MQPAQAKNRAPAEIQITAEQLLREARDRQTDEEHLLQQRSDAQLQQIQDPEELALHQLTQRKDFETKLRNTLHNVSNYLRYAKWEESQLEFRRARSIYERAVEVDYKNYVVWLKYGEFEMKNKFINHARNVWNRAVTLLPRVSQLWYKYVHMEEVLGAADNVRVVFERWLKWEPEKQAWYSYINFEERCGELEKARDIYERYCATFPYPDAYVKYASWEERHKQLALSRKVYERAFEEVPAHIKDQDNDFPSLFLKFAEFEQRCRESERARGIFKAGLDLLPKSKSKALYSSYIKFEKQYGKRDGIDGVILSKKRLDYERAIRDEPRDYDAWFNYIRLEESQTVEQANQYSLSLQLKDKLNKESSMNTDSDAVELERSRLIAFIREGRDRVRDLYERAISNVPPVGNVKQYWRRYVYLWIYYATFEEVIVKDLARASLIYENLLYHVLHKHINATKKQASKTTDVSFTFSKIWIKYAELELRRKDIEKVRRILGQAIGVSIKLQVPKKKIFYFYIKLERTLGDISRVRTLYEKFIESFPQDGTVWLSYITLEKQVKELDRCRALFEAAIRYRNEKGDHVIQGVEMIWKKYIDFEIKNGTVDKAGTLYERLLKVKKHVKVYAAYATFLAEQAKQAEKARAIFKTGHEYIKQEIAKLKNFGTYDRNHVVQEALDETTQAVLKKKEDRKLLLDRWLAVEQRLLAGGSSGSATKTLQAIRDLMPRKIKKRKYLTREEGEENEDYIEYFELMFPEEQQQQKGMKLLEIAQKWKLNKALKQQEGAHAASPAASKDTNEIDLDD